LNLSNNIYILPSFDIKSTKDASCSFISFSHLGAASIKALICEVNWVSKPDVFAV